MHKDTPQEQVTLNEAIESATGHPAPANTVPIPVDPPKRSPTKPGFVSKFVHIPEQKWQVIAKHIEDNYLDEGRFLTRKMSEIADSFSA